MGVAMVVVTLILLCLVNGVESARAMSVAIEQRGAAASTVLSFEVADDGWRTPTTTVRALNADGVEDFSGSGGGGVDPVWDAEAESPPAQRQRDRSLWGMSKRLVPTGPNPLHN